jgi:hypothetical protein
MEERFFELCELLEHRNALIEIIEGNLKPYRFRLVLIEYDNPPSHDATVANSRKINEAS